MVAGLRQLRFSMVQSFISIKKSQVAPVCISKASVLHIMINHKAAPLAPSRAFYKGLSDSTCISEKEFIYALMYTGKKRLLGNPICIQGEACCTPVSQSKDINTRGLEST